MLRSYEVNKKIERISNVSVLDAELTTGKLTVWRKKHESERAVDVLTTFFWQNTFGLKMSTAILFLFLGLNRAVELALIM